MYNVYQHWDPLKACIVGRSYRPEFYSFIANPKIRTVIERIAEETEEDYQKLIKLLESFDCKVLRPNVSDDYDFYQLTGTQKVLPPPMTPRDYSIMLGKDFYFRANNLLATLDNQWSVLRGSDWPECAPKSYQEYADLPEFIKKELHRFAIPHSQENFGPVYDFDEFNTIDQYTWKPVIDHIVDQGNLIFNSVPFALHKFNSATSTRVGRDIYVGTEYYGQDKSSIIDGLSHQYPDYRWHTIDTGGHSDATYCAVCPGLIVSLHDIPQETYDRLFPGWEIVYLPKSQWDNVKPFQDIKNKNNGKWWVPGEESNDEFTNFVESWMQDCLGYVEETVFDVNMLVIDKKNIVCNNYNEKVFRAFERYGITPHIIDFRHRYFWDGGLHCVTSDLHREGILEDYFPGRN